MKRLLAALAAATLAAALAASGAGAVAPAPALYLTSLATPTAFIPEDSAGNYTYDLRIANLGAAPTDGSDIVLADSLPAGLTVSGVNMALRSIKPGTSGGVFDYGPEACQTEASGGVETVTCTLSETLPEAEEPATLQPGEERRVVIHLTPGALVEGETLTNHVEAQGGGAPPVAIDVDNEAATLIEGEPQPAPAGLSFFNARLTGLDGQPVGQAASHPYQLSFGFAVHTKTPPPGSEALFVPAGGDLRNISGVLPPGLIGNPTAASPCTAQQFNTSHQVNLSKGGLTSFYFANDCPESSAVGMVLVQQIEGEAGVLPIPLYNLVPPPGMPAQLGMQILGVPFYIDAEVRPDHRYRIFAAQRNLSQVKRLTAATVVIWGTPADPHHDPLRGECLNQLEAFGISRCEAPAEIEEKPFLRLPTNCAEPLDIGIGVDTWSAVSYGESDDRPAPVGCNQVPFEPRLEARPSTDVADSPAGLHADLHIPQAEYENPEGLGQADLRKTVVILPEGLVLNPSSANGLDACSEAQIGYLGKSEGADSFSDEAASCPPAARIGTVEVDTPLIDHPLPGSVYVAMPGENPFNSLLAIYIAVHDPRTGVVVKLAGHVEPDPATGRLTTIFEETPQTPFEDFRLDFFGGAGAALRTPAVCGNYATDSVMTPWSAPESGAPVSWSDPYAITKAPGGGACPTSPAALPNAPSFHAGTVAPIAAAFSPLVMSLKREDGSQEFSQLTLTPPPGLLGRLAGIPYCPEAALAAAAAKSGKAEKANPSCPAASQVGTVTVGAGAGPAPYYTTGRAYLTGPYKGAPLSLAIITPATAGPYDLGTVVVRTALHVDPETAGITAVSDIIPHILQGIPLDVRSIAVRIDRPQFTLNPTNCDPLSFGGRLQSTLGQSAALSDRFQVGECGALGFKPKLSLRLFGKTNRGAHPALRAVLAMPAGNANIASTSVALPHSEFLEQAHIRTICTRVQFAAKECPAGSIYGHVTATSPLVDYPLEGPVYLRSSSHKLPDLVLALHGPPSQPVEIDAVGRVDSVRGGIRTRFEAVPDAPLSKLVLEMQGGAKGLLVNSRDVCASANRARIKLTAQNGKLSEIEPALKDGKCGKHKRHKRHRGR
jgi:hypothetical protein